MALKDWVKLERIFPAWLNKKTDEQIYIFSDTKNNKKVYNITSNKYRTTFNNEFNITKSQALKFAKSYMRSH